MQQKIFAMDNEIDFQSDIMVAVLAFLMSFVFAILFFEKSFIESMYSSSFFQASFVVLAFANLIVVHAFTENRLKTLSILTMESFLALVVYKLACYISIVVDGSGSTEEFLASLAKISGLFMLCEVAGIALLDIGFYLWLRKTISNKRDIVAIMCVIVVLEITLGYQLFF
ncbi:MAG: hypothetical protein A2288_03640 [Candidatus Moranbacteria bacterium RIFOXYA12_FULL_44_15]|nr:MAG: hypothetical protein A2288_03640 [Candidatus Moranbacteria bacterium RIFOXYA12_FULL_44_15]OGI36467.1 MAG: hypothetical protein A2259_01960 [Candidatus Moranbacteria bacterium RIFOXYA2_FULL_43_15]